MLRIGPGAPVGQSQPMQQPEVQLPDDSQEPDADDQGGAPDDDSDDQGDDSGKIDQANAGYQGPENGPFICANCIFFDNGHCEVVAGQVDHLGCCNNFTSMKQNAPQDQDGGNTTGDQSNAAQSDTDEATTEQPSSDTSGY